jgi:hypothetical protein
MLQGPDTSRTAYNDCSLNQTQATVNLQQAHSIIETMVTMWKLLADG